MIVGFMIAVVGGLMIRVGNLYCFICNSANQEMLWKGRLGPALVTLGWLIAAGGTYLYLISLPFNR